MRRRLVPTHNLILNLCCNRFPTPDLHIIVINKEFTCSIYLALVNAVHDQYQMYFSFHSNKKIKQKELLFSTDMSGMMSLLHLLRRKTLFFFFFCSFHVCFLFQTYWSKIVDSKYGKSPYIRYVSNGSHCNHLTIACEKMKPKQNKQ